MELNYHVIEDVQADVDRLVREAGKTRELRFRGSYASAYEALADFRAKRVFVPIIFCDIRLRDGNGLDAGPELAKYCRHLVFVTGLPGQQGLVLDARGDEHLQKPVTCDQLRMRVLDRFYKRHGEEIPIYIHLNKIFIYNVLTKQYDMEALRNIQYLTHERNYLTVVAKGNKTYTARDTVARAYSLLEPAGIFVRVNRGTILNMQCVSGFDHTEARIGTAKFSLLGEGKKEFEAYLQRYTLGDGGT